jgi:hypothetical protein
MLNWNYVPQIGEIVYAEREGSNKRFVVLPTIGVRTYPSVTLWEIIGFGYELSKVCYGDDVKDAWEDPYAPVCSYRLTVLHGNKSVNLFNSPLILHNE